MTRQGQINEAAELIGASKTNGGYIYYAQETSEWWLVSEADLLDLSELMHDDDDDIRGNAYSHWCSSAPGECVGDSEAARERNLIS